MEKLTGSKVMVINKVSFKNYNFISFDMREFIFLINKKILK